MKTEKKATPGQTERNKELLRQAIQQIWNGGNFEAMEEFVSRDFVIRSYVPEEEIRGAENAKQFYKQLHQAFPDIHFTIIDQVAEGDKVVTHWTASGTHGGEFRGIPPTGKRFRINAIDIDRIVEGKVVECWSNMDELGLLRQLGVIPASE